MNAEIQFTKWQKPRTERHCHGCRDEFKIIIGTDYLHVVVRLKEEGKKRRLVAIDYCPRCALAMISKVRSGKKMVNLEEGSLRWDLLAAPFKKQWNGYVGMIRRYAACTSPVEREALKTTIDSIFWEMSRWG